MQQRVTSASQYRLSWIWTGILFLFAVLSQPLAHPMGTLSVIYGPDDRKEYFEIKNRKWKDLAESTVVLIDAKFLEIDEDENYWISSETYGEENQLCPHERFYHQPAAGFCSGVLVQQDLVLTAGHCVPTQKACNKTFFVFDYALHKSRERLKSFGSHQVFECKELVYQVLNQKQGDYAVVRLDRPVGDRDPVKWRKSGEIGTDDTVTMMGYPHGLPLKIVQGADVKKESGWGFVSEVDASASNSGAPVFNDRTGLLEGILIRGESDFRFDSESHCYRSKRCKGSDCSGEFIAKVSRIRSIISH